MDRLLLCHTSLIVILENLQQSQFQFLQKDIKKLLNRVNLKEKEEIAKEFTIRKVA